MFHSAFWRKDWRTKGRLSTWYPHVESPDRSAQTSKMQVATFSPHHPPRASFCNWSFVKDAVPCDARGAGPSSRRTTRISHEGFGTPRGPPARSLGRGTCCSTLSATARNCSHPAGSNMSSCSRPLKQFIIQFDLTVIDVPETVGRSSSVWWLSMALPDVTKSYRDFSLRYLLGVTAVAEWQMILSARR